MSEVKVDERTRRKLAKLAKLGGEATKKKGSEYYSQIGKMSAAKKDSSYFSMMGKKSAEARARRKEQETQKKSPFKRLERLITGS